MQGKSSHLLAYVTRLAPLLLMPVLSASAADGITGDWNGRRDAWMKQGVDLDFGYTVEAARNLSGGTRRATAHAGQLAAAGRFDLERLWGWSGMRAEASLSLRDGDSVDARAGLGTLMQTQEIYGRGHILRLGRAWLARSSADGRYTVKAGRVQVGDDFNTLDCIAMNLALCGSQPGAFAGDYWHNWPLSQWGGVFEYRPATDRYLRAGVYQVNPRYADTAGGGLRIAPAGTQGTLTPVELGWTPTVRGLAAHYAVGGWYSSAPRADAVQPLGAGTITAAPVMRNGAHGGWASAQQQLTRGNGSSERSGLRGQLAFAQGDQRSGHINQMLGLQLIHTGTFDSRAEDRIGFGLASTRLNPRAARAMRDRDGGERAHREYVAEVFYGWRAVRGVDLQPGVQYIRHPGGLGTGRDAFVVGLKADLRF